MIVLGVDPGIERVGWGFVEMTGSKLRMIDYGCIVTPRVQTADRLLQIHETLKGLIEQHTPDCMAVEKLIFAANKTTAFDVAKGIGAILLAGAKSGLPLHEYSPAEVKSAVVGHGAADKKQVQFMVQRVLSLTETPKPDDAADALAIAICCAFRAPALAALNKALTKGR